MPQINNEFATLAIIYIFLNVDSYIYVFDALKNNFA